MVSVFLIIACVTKNEGAVGVDGGADDTHDTHDTATCSADTGCPDLSTSTCAEPGVYFCDCCDQLWDCQGHPDAPATFITTTFGCDCLTQDGTRIDTGDRDCQLGE